MQKIQRKKEKQLSSKLLIAASAVFLLLCGGALWLLNRQDQPRPAATEPERDCQLYQKDVGLLSSVDLYRNGELQLTLLCEEGTLSVKDRPGYPVSETASENLKSLAQQLTADEFIMDLPDDEDFSLKPFGLDPPERSARFRYTDGTEIVLSVGSLMPIENPRYYALVSGQNALYSVTQVVRDDISRTLENLRTIDRPQINSKLLDRIEVSGDMTFDAVRTPQGWQMLEPAAYPLSEAAVNQLLSQLDELRFSGWIGDAETLDLASLGLAPPIRTMTVTFAETIVTAPDESGENVSFALPSNQLSFSLGNSRSETSFYLMYENQVYTGTVLSFSFFKNFSWEKYLLARPVSLPVQALSGLVWQENGQTAEYQFELTERVLKNNELETDKSGNVLYDLLVRHDGETIDADQFVEWYLSLAGLGGTQRAEQRRQTPDDRPVFSLTLVYGDRSGQRTISVCPFSAVQDLLFVDGVSLYLTDISWRSVLSGPPGFSSGLQKDSGTESPSALPSPAPMSPAPGAE